MRVLVTGGAGFIGSHLVDALLSRGDEVVVLDNFSSGRMENLKQHEGNPRFELIKGDVRRPEDIREALVDVDAAIHEAAIVSVPFSVEHPEITYDVNVEGTSNLIEEAVKQEVDRVVFASSCAVYGNAETIPTPEDAPPNPLTPYAESKLKAEMKCVQSWKTQGCPVVILRYFNVYGPRQPPGEYAGVMIKFREKILRGEPPVIYGDGKQTRDFIFVDDVVDATLLAVDRGPAGEIINVGTGIQTSINKLCEIFLKVAGKNLAPVYLPPRPGDILYSCADIQKARSVLNFKPKVKVEEGVKKLLGALT